jgi:hypothetical protein
MTEIQELTDHSCKDLTAPNRHFQLHKLNPMETPAAVQEELVHPSCPPFRLLKWWVLQEHSRLHCSQSPTHPLTVQVPAAKAEKRSNLQRAQESGPIL